MVSPGIRREYFYHGGYTMEGKTWGYARTSTQKQNEDRQLIALREFGVEEKNIVVDKQSGKDFDRPGYQKLVRKLKKGDTLAILSIDRLGRNYEQIQEQWRRLTKQMGVHIVVLDMPLLDTRQEHDLSGTLIADIVLQLLGYVAEIGRINICQRVNEGVQAAKARGVRFGRPPMEKPEGFEDAVRRYQNKEISARQAGRELGVSHACFLRWVSSMQNAK
jgi:DNA invertase Pin-like site-specific DNA recombinase